MPEFARTGRAFLRRAVRHITGQGVRQFLDLGAGVPADGNVHEVAGTVRPDARVVYVDIDPVAVAEVMDLLAGQYRHAAVWGDLRDPAAVLGNPQVREVLNFEQPVGLLLLGVLHFVPDDHTARDAVGAYVRALAPGSYVAISHLTSDEQDVDQADLDAARDLYRTRTGHVPAPSFGNAPAPRSRHSSTAWTWSTPGSPGHRCGTPTPTIPPPRARIPAPVPATPLSPGSHRSGQHRAVTSHAARHPPPPETRPTGAGDRQGIRVGTRDSAGER
jgi:hypothetical protein